MSDAQVSDPHAPRSRPRRLFRRGPWENASSAIIGIGILFLVQPFSLDAYGWSFAVILAGTLAFVVTSHFAE